MRCGLVYTVAVALLTQAFSTASHSSSSSSIDNDTVSAPSNATLRWKACSTQFSMECATFNVTACHASLDGGCSIGNALPQSLVLRRVRNTKAAVGPTLWVLHDSILSKQPYEQLMVQLSSLANSDVYMLASRLFDSVPYANGSSPTFCRQLAASYQSSLSVNASMLSTVAQCKNWIDSKFGTNGIRAFSLDSAVQDLALAMKAVSTTSNSPYIYASGRAVRVVPRLLSLLNVSVAGVIYDSPAPMPIAEEPVGIAMTRFVAACDSDPSCSNKLKGLSTSFAKVLQTLYTTIDRTSKPLSTCFELLYETSFDSTRDLKPSHGVRRLLMFMRKTSPSGSQAIPPVLYRLTRCDRFDIKFLHRFFDKIRSRMVTEAFGESEMVAFIDEVVSFSEFWPALQPRDQLVSTFEASPMSTGIIAAQQPSYCAFSGNSDASCLALYADGLQPNKSSTLSYAAPTLKTAVPKTDVLLIASRLSPIGAATAASELFDSLTTDTIGNGNRTVMMVQSDAMTSTELASNSSLPLLNVVALFLRNRARNFNGKWHVSDLTSLSFEQDEPSAAGAISSLETKASSADFGMTVEDSRSWFGQSNPYEGYKVTTSRGGEVDDPSLAKDEGSGISFTSWTITGGVIIVTIVGVMIYLRSRFQLKFPRRQRLSFHLPYDTPAITYQSDHPRAILVQDQTVLVFPVQEPPSQWHPLPEAGNGDNQYPRPWRPLPSAPAL